MVRPLHLFRDASTTGKDPLLMMSSHVTSDFVEGCRESLRRCQAIVSQLTDEQYRTASGNRSSIGAHLRHCVEHYQCFLLGLPKGVVNYDARERNAELEVGRHYMAEALSNIIDLLADLSPLNSESEVLVMTTGSLNGGIREVKSSLGRELSFLSSHTIHHLALINLMAEVHGCSLDGQLGLAFSTEANNRSNGTPNS